MFGNDIPLFWFLDPGLILVGLLILAIYGIANLIEHLKARRKDYTRKKKTLSPEGKIVDDKVKGIKGNHSIESKEKARKQECLNRKKDHLHADKQKTSADEKRKRYADRQKAWADKHKVSAAEQIKRYANKQKTWADGQKESANVKNTITSHEQREVIKNNHNNESKGNDGKREVKVRVKCSRCGSKLVIKRKDIIKEIKCPKCSNIFRCGRFCLDTPAI